MRILLTGITGFAGCHLAEALLTGRDVQLFGASRRPHWPQTWRHLANQVVLQGCDLGDAQATEALLRQAQPDQVYHLAGYASPRQSHREPDAAWSGNLTATRSLYEAIGRWGGKPRVLYVGSGLVYGDPENPERAQDEGVPLRPDSPYASSKAAADLASYQYTRTLGLDIVRVRPFNHTGPGQSLGYVTADFAHQIAAFEKWRAGTGAPPDPPYLKTGDLRSQRDLTDVRDMVRAYILLMERGRTGDVYNAGTGEVHSMQELLDALLSLSRVRIEVRQEFDPARAADTRVARADASKLRRETGWQPRFTLRQTLADTLDYWRQQP
jgi:GDP-4-dehydro-6-deoxy-D-mannose reductase